MLRLSLLARCLISFAAAASFFSVCRAGCADELPPTSDRAPVAVDHFPSRLYAVVWRNWGLVPVDRLANVLGATPEQVTTLAISMGLPEKPEVPAEMDARGYITILKRNWHLLPYSQITKILNVTDEELAFRLREDDFLYHKLGQFKPKCEEIRYAPPDAATAERAAEIRKLVAPVFADHRPAKEEPQFAFVETLSKLPAGAEISAPLEELDGLRYCYSYFALFGDPLSQPQLDPYPDGILARLRDRGVNGIWMHVVLRQLSPPTKDFPEFGEGHEVRIANLAKLVERARRFGIRIYLYMNEPRMMPEAFFKDRPEMIGVAEGPYRAMCTSDVRVRQWIEDSLANLFEKVPNLGGVFTITGSENQTHCASHGRHETCPRCKSRTSTEIQVELIEAIERGVHRSSPNAKVIVWDWGWFGKIGDGKEIIPKLPKSVWLQSVSEWALPIERGGVISTVGEYSISSVGPGPRATEHWKLAKAAGLKTVAKVQLNNTWEISTVPYLPVMELVAEHCSNLRKQDVDGLMMSWSLGGYPSLNQEIAQRFWKEKNPTIDSVLDALAKEHYGDKAALFVREAWKEFSNAFREFPFDGAVVYNGPQQAGPSNLLHLKPTGYRATMVGFAYDDLDGWRSIYPPEVFASQFEKVAKGWSIGLLHLQWAYFLVPEAKREFAMFDLCVARAAALHFASVANQARFILARDAWRKAPAGPEREKLREELLTRATRERDLAKELYELASADSRLGYEASNHYAYVPNDLVEQIINCEWIKGELAK